MSLRRIYTLCAHDFTQKNEIEKEIIATPYTYMYLFFLGDAGKARALLENSADPTLENKDGESAIWIAGLAGHEEITRLLIEVNICRLVISQPICVSEILIFLRI